MYAGIAASFPASYPTLSRVPLRAYNSRTWHRGGSFEHWLCDMRVYGNEGDGLRLPRL